MSKAFSDTEFSDQITKDRSWRLREISDLRSAALRADSNLQRVLLRAIVTVCYAHWEGYVRFAARKYLEHVALRRLQYKDLDRQFFRNYLLPKLATLSSSRPSVADRCSFVDEVLNSFDRRFSRVNEELVNTRANLNFGVFKDICLVCSIPVPDFADKAFLDIFLLNRRNAIAHGEETLVDLKDLDTLTDRTISIMRAFGDALENRVFLKEYRST